jgi:two-component system chemotaxis response regulator CheY
MVKTLNILIVEDEFVSRTLLSEMLSPYGECEVVDNGLDATKIFRAACGDSGSRFDLVCLDIMMPGMSGHQVLKEIRDIEKSKGLAAAQSAKVLMVTSLDDAKNIMEALVVGRCQAYLTKPVSKGRLEEQLRYLRLI